MAIMHFKSQKERLDYLKGNFEEIIPQIAKEEEPKEAVEKPKKAKKSAKKSKKEDENGEIQAE